MVVEPSYLPTGGQGRPRFQAMAPVLTGGDARSLTHSSMQRPIRRPPPCKRQNQAAGRSSMSVSARTATSDAPSGPGRLSRFESLRG